MPITDKYRAQQFLEKAEEMLDQLSKEYGYGKGNLKLRWSRGQVKINYRSLSSDVLMGHTVEATDFRLNCANWNLPKSALYATFSWKLGSYRIIGAKPRNRTYKIITENLYGASKGGHCKWPLSFIRQLHEEGKLIAPSQDFLLEVEKKAEETLGGVAAAELAALAKIPSLEAIADVKDPFSEGPDTDFEFEI